VTKEEESEHVKEVYAQFGLAVYFAQVLEHQVVNSLVILDLIPTRRHLARSPDEWGVLVEDFMDRHFKRTLGALIGTLATVTSVPAGLADRLDAALLKRNWLAHAYFRERSGSFLSEVGRWQMLEELHACRELFSSVDRELTELVEPLFEKAGLTADIQAREYERFVKESRGNA
jgi:hypothetical protein